MKPDLIIDGDGLAKRSSVGLTTRVFPRWHALLVNILIALACALLAGLFSERFIFRGMRQTREAQE